MLGSFGDSGGVDRYMPVTLPAAGIDPGLFIANARLVDSCMDAPGAVFVREGKIIAVYEGEEARAMWDDLDGASVGCGSGPGPGLPEVFDARGLVLMPSFVDLHAHFRDPGMTAKEDLSTASRAACAGGYGTVVLMANTDPVVSTIDTAREINARVREIGLIDSFQAISLTRDFGGTDVSALETLDAREVPVASEDGRDVSSSDVMREAMSLCARTGVVVSCHCEDASVAAGAKPLRASALAALREGRVADAHASLAAAESILRDAEDVMTERNIALALETGCRVNITHASTTRAMDLVRLAKKRIQAIAPGSSDGNPSVTCDVTPHHLALTSDTLEIVNPPLRSEADRQALIAGIFDGTVDAIATDHAPHTIADKAAGAPGFSGIQTAFAVCNTALVATGIIGLSRLSGLMSANPARLLGLKRGRLLAGYDADLVLVDPDARTLGGVADGIADGATGWYSKSANTPFAGKELAGCVRKVWKRGIPVFPFKPA